MRSVGASKWEQRKNVPDEWKNISLNREQLDLFWDWWPTCVTGTEREWHQTKTQGLMGQGKDFSN